MAFYRTRIQRKPCKHTDCDNLPKQGCGGYCWEHQKEDPGYERKVQKKALKKDKKKIKLLSVGNPDKSFVANSGLSQFQLLENWFTDRAKEIVQRPVCAECQSWIPAYYVRSSTAHVLPKRKEYGFPSVATHPLNYLTLGAKCGCHQRFDSSWDDASKMKVWPIAVAIFKEIYPSIVPEEHKNIPDILRKHIP